MKKHRQPDLVLLHPPCVYDFREMLRLPSPVADLVPSGAVFDMYPIGFSFLGEYLERHGFKVRIANLAARMLAEPSFDARKFIRGLSPLAFGIDLHWLPHAHGAIEVARLCKEEHPVTPVIMGGYSATIFHEELMGYPQVDFVVRGDSAEEPLRRLMVAIRDGGDVSTVCNLTRRADGAGEIVSSELSFVPPDLDHLGENYGFMVRSAARSLDPRGVRAYGGWWSHPLTAVLTVKGCLNNCAFCGGSSFAMSRCMGREGIAVRPPADVARELCSISSFTGAPIFIIGDVRQPGEEWMGEVLERAAAMRVKNMVVLELFAPADEGFFRRVSSAFPRYAVEFSPETHDDRLRELAGKPYTSEQVESTVAAALRCGCTKFDIFFIIGLQAQDRESVMDTVAWCGKLLHEHGPRLNPLIGPLAPFLDPGSIARERSGANGYRVLLDGLEEHRQAMLEPHWRDLLGYETGKMSRQDIVDVTYEAMRELTEIKARCGRVSRQYASRMLAFLDRSEALLGRFDVARAIEDAGARDAEMSAIRREADAVREEGHLVKEELAWPLAGRRFRAGGILRMLKKGTRDG